MSKSKKKQNNEEKKNRLGIESRTRRLLIKINQEQVVYYNEPDGNEELSKRVDHLIDLKKQINALKDTDDAPSVALRESLSSEFDTAMKEKNEWLTRYCEEKGYLVAFFDNIRSIDPDHKQYEVFAAPHDKDVFWDNFFQSHPEDYHIHIVFLGRINKATNKRRIFKVRDVLDMLHIRYDEKRDLSVLDNGAIQVCKHISDSIQYLLHWTALSEEEGKYIYDRDVLVTNDEEAADAYLNASPEMGKTRLLRMTAEEASRYAPAFREQGKALVSFKNAFLNVGFPEWFWYSSEGNKRNMSIFEKAYVEGLEKGASMTHIDRINLFIFGNSEIGKTTAVEHLCDSLSIPRDTIFNAHNGYGKYDGLEPKHRILVADDTSLTDVLKIADERVAILPQRNRGKAIWSGDLVIVTSNEEPEQFFHQYNGTYYDKDGKICGTADPKYDSRISRFVIIKADSEGNLKILTPCMRGSRLEKVFERQQVVNEMVRIMEESTKEYCSLQQMSPSEVLKYPSREIALFARESPAKREFVDRHLNLYPADIKVYMDEYEGKSFLLFSAEEFDWDFYDSYDYIEKRKGEALF